MGSEMCIRDSLCRGQSAESFRDWQPFHSEIAANCHDVADVVVTVSGAGRRAGLGAFGLMYSSIARFAGRWARTLFAISVVYSAVAALLMFSGLGGSAVTDFIGAWGSMPVSIAICIVLWPSLFDASNREGHNTMQIAMLTGIEPHAPMKSVTAEPPNPENMSNAATAE